MLEILTANQIVGISKSWQQKLDSSGPISYGDLFAEVKDITQIRVTAGLVSQINVPYSFDLPTKEAIFHLVFAPKNHFSFRITNGSYVGITVCSIDDQTREGYYIEDGEDPLNNLDFGLKKRVFKVKEGVSFKSPLTGEEHTMQGKIIYEDQDKVGGCSRNRILARAIWHAHLANDAPLQGEYNPQCTTRLYKFSTE